MPAFCVSSDVLYGMSHYDGTLFRESGGLQGYPPDYEFGTGGYTSRLHGEYADFMMDGLDKTAKVLDFGCGYGLFLRSLRVRGFSESIGVELDHDVRGRAAEISGRPVYRDIPQSEKYGAVSMMDVLEHLTDPVETLSMLRRYVDKDAVLFISTPNVDSINARLYRERWVLHLPPQHVFYFGLRGIRIMLERSGWALDDHFTKGDLFHNERSSAETWRGAMARTLFGNKWMNELVNHRAKVGSIIAVRARAV
jgi:SAM-dependent methyltransferase